MSAVPSITVTSISCTVISNINEQHRLARSCAETAVRHAIRCGELLLEQKGRVEHGEFGKWIATHCEFEYSTAARYMKAACQNSTGVEISSLSSLFSSGRKTATTGGSANLPTQARAAELLNVSERGVRADRHHRKDGLATAVEPARSTDNEITIDLALKMMPMESKYSALKCRVTQGRNRVTLLRNQLSEAETKLSEAEAAVIAAAMELKRITAAEQPA